MNLPWKILFVVLIGLQVFLLFRDLSRKDSSAPSEPSSVVITNIVNSVSAPSPTPVFRGANDRSTSISSNGFPVVKSPRYFRGEFVFGCAGSDSWVYFDGDLFRFGCPSEYGRVILIDKNFVICSEDGVITYLLPRDLNKITKNSGARIPSPRFTSSGDGMPAPRGPW